MTLETSTAFMRDKFVLFSDAKLSVASSPVLYGLSIYTVFRVTCDQDKLIIFRLKDHYQRLVKSAQIMDFDSFATEWPYSKFERHMIELLSRNQIDEDVLVRVSVFIDEIVAGTRIHGLKNNLSAYIYPAGQILSSKGVHLCVSSWLRTPDNAIPSRAKVNGSYVNASLMKNEAILNGYDDAIALDVHGHVTESTVANIFLVRDRQLVTPAQSSDVLEGITRNTVIEIANKLNLDITERPIDRSELYLADEIFISGSSANIVPVLSVDKRQVGNGRLGEITKQIKQDYMAALSGREGKEEWCTMVDRL